MKILKNYSYGLNAWFLNRILLRMNDETAYYGSNWLYIWPDECSFDDCMEFFNDKESYNLLYDSFKWRYKEFHKYGLYEADEDILKFARKIDKELNLEPIKNIRFKYPK